MPAPSPLHISKWVNKYVFPYSSSTTSILEAINKAWLDTFPPLTATKKTVKEKHKEQRLPFWLVLATFFGIAHTLDKNNNLTFQQFWKNFAGWQEGQPLPASILKAPFYILWNTFKILAGLAISILKIPTEFLFRAMANISAYGITGCWQGLVDSEKSLPARALRLASLLLLLPFYVTGRIVAIASTMVLSPVKSAGSAWKAGCQLGGPLLGMPFALFSIAGSTVGIAFLGPFGLKVLAANIPQLANVLGHVVSHLPKIIEAITHVPVIGHVFNALFVRPLKPIVSLIAKFVKHADSVPTVREVAHPVKEGVKGVTETWDKIAHALKEAGQAIHHWLKEGTPANPLPQPNAHTASPPSIPSSLHSASSPFTPKMK